MTIREFIIGNTVGIHYAVRIFVGCILLWGLTQAIKAPSPLWAIISLIIVTEPQAHLAWLAFRTRMLNTLMGAIVGFCALAFVGPTPWTLIIAIAFTALVSTYINRVHQGWRIAPITTALVISAGMAQQSVANGMDVALARTLEVFIGSTVALLVSVVFARIWLPPMVVQARRSTDPHPLAQAHGREAIDHGRR